MPEPMEEADKRRIMEEWTERLRMRASRRGLWGGAAWEGFVSLSARRVPSVDFVL